MYNKVLVTMFKTFPKKILTTPVQKLRRKIV